MKKKNKKQTAKRQEKKLDLSRKVMADIESGKVKMRPKVYFVTGSILLALGFAGALIVAVFFANLSVFHLRVHGSVEYLRFGRLGIRPFVANFPWKATLIALIGLFSGVVFLKKYDVSYKKSFFWLVSGLAAVVLMSGFLVDRIGINERVESVKKLRSLYENSHSGKGGFVVGKVVEAGPRKFLLRSVDGDLVKVVVSDKTRGFERSRVNVGDVVRVVGKIDGDRLEAMGIINIGHKVIRDRLLRLHELHKNKQGGFERAR